MRIVACYKCVPENEQIEVRTDQSLNLKNAEWSVGQYDLNAVEAGMQLVETAGGEVSVLTAAGDIVDNSKLKKAILSRGPAQMYGIRMTALDSADAYVVGTALKAGVEKIGNVDLVLCGEGSSDIYAQQTGSMLGAMLGWNTLNAVSTVREENGHLVVERNLENEIEILEVELPAVLSVTSSINKPRIPKLKEIMAAGKKPSTIWSGEELGICTEAVTETVSILAPKQAERKQIIFEGAADETIEEVCKHIRKVL